MGHRYLQNLLICIGHIEIVLDFKNLKVCIVEGLTAFKKLHRLCTGPYLLSTSHRNRMLCTKGC